MLSEDALVYSECNIKVELSFLLEKVTQGSTYIAQ